MVWDMFMTTERFTSTSTSLSTYRIDDYDDDFVPHRN